MRLWDLRLEVARSFGAMTFPIRALTPSTLCMTRRPVSRMASTISSTCPSAVLLAFTTPDEATDDRSFSVGGTLTDGAGAPLSGATIAIDEAGSSIGSAVVGSNGTWSAAILLPDLGTNTLIASYVDGGGVATTSAPLTLTLDTVLSPPSSLPGTGQAINVVRPAFDGTVFGTAGVDDFVFRPHPGHATVEGFDLSSHHGRSSQPADRTLRQLRGGPASHNHDGRQRRHPSRPGQLHHPRRGHQVGAASRPARHRSAFLTCARYPWCPARQPERRHHSSLAAPHTRPAVRKDDASAMDRRRSKRATTVWRARSRRSA